MADQYTAVTVKEGHDKGMVHRTLQEVLGMGVRVQDRDARSRVLVVSAAWAEVESAVGGNAVLCRSVFRVEVVWT